MTGDDSTLVTIPKSTYDLVKKHISLKKKGVYKKGLIMEFVNNAVLKEILTERGAMQAAAHTHKMRSRSKKRSAMEEEARQLNGIVLNLALQKDLNVEQGLSRRIAEIALVQVGKDSRTVKANLNLLEAYGYVAPRRSREDIRPLLDDLA